MSPPPVPEDAFKATKYDVGTKVMYIGSDGEFKGATAMSERVPDISP